MMRFLKWRKKVYKVYKVFDSYLLILFVNASKFINRSTWKQIKGNGRKNSNLKISLQKNLISFKSKHWRNIQQSLKCFEYQHLGGAFETERYVKVFSHFKSANAFVLISQSFQTVGFFFQVSCLLIKSYKCKQKNHKAFSHPLYLHYYELWGAENFFGNRKLQKTWLVTLSGPLAAILKFTQKCKQTAVSLKLSKIKIFFCISLHPIRCLNFWDDKNFWGGQLVPPSPATSVKYQKHEIYNERTQIQIQ